MPFQRAILESGSPGGDPGVSGNGTIKSTSTVANLAGCASQSSKTTLSCLRKLTYQKLFAAVIKYENLTATAGTYQDIFYPTVDNDYIPAAPNVLLRQGKFHKNISVIAGWTYNDGSLFTDPNLSSSSDVDEYLQKAYPFLNSTTRQHLTTTLYPLPPFNSLATTLSAPSPYFLQAANIYRDINFACPALFTTQQITLHSPNTSTYLYDFNTTSFGLLEQFANATFLGVLHTSEILFAFNRPALGGLLPISDEQKNIGRRVSGSWARFASTGKPTEAVAATKDDALADWDAGFNKTGEVNVRVIGGPNADQHTLKLNGDGDGVEARLLERCAFVNSEEVQRQVQT